MHITYSDKLKAYMAQKGYRHLIVESVSAIGCCADTAELGVRFVDAKGAERLRAKHPARIFPTECGEVYVMDPSIEIEDEVRFDLRSFLGLKDVTVKGMAPWHL